VTAGTVTDYATFRGQQVPVRETPKGDGDRWYLYPADQRKLLSVTAAISDTIGAAYLHTWHAKQAARSVLVNLAHYQRVIEEQGLDAALDEAKEEGERARLIKADTGSYVHAVIEALILWAASPEGAGDQIPLPDLPGHLENADYDGTPLPEVAGFMVDGFLEFCARFRPEFEAAEMIVFNLTLGVAGTLDMIIVLADCAISAGTGPRGEDEIIACPGSRLILCVDVKTGKHYKVEWKDQIAIYRRMEEALLRLGELIPMPATHAGAVLHLRPGSEYDLGYRLMLVSGKEDEAAAARFTDALSLLNRRREAPDKPGAVIYPLNPDGTMPSPRIADMDRCGYGRAPGALVRALGRDVTAADVAGFTEDEILGAKGIGEKTLPVIGRILADHRLSFKPGSVPAEPGKAA